MTHAVYIVDQFITQQLFAFDVDENESRELEIEWTDKPIESGNNIADYGVLKPEIFTIEGSVTAWPLNPSGQDEQRVIDIIQDLRKIAMDKQPVTVVTRYWANNQVCLGKVAIKSSASEGELITITVDCKVVETVEPTTTTVPKSRLRSDIKPAVAAKPKGTKPGNPSWLDGSAPTNTGQKARYYWAEATNTKSSVSDPNAIPTIW